MDLFGECHWLLLLLHVVTSEDIATTSGVKLLLC
jgi:hypothetical protein